MKRYVIILFVSYLQCLNAQWDESNQLLQGTVIDGVFGKAVAISDDGNYLAVSDPLRFFLSNGPKSVTIYKRENDSWLQVDQLFNESNDDSEEFGDDIDFSDNGQFLAVGIDDADNINNRVRVYQNENGSWEPFGNDILKPQEIQTLNYGEFVSFSGDGSTLVVSAPADFGQVSVHRLINDEWTQIGNVLGGSDPFFGVGISINDDGTLMAIGILEAFDENGRVEIYEINENDFTLVSTIRGSLRGGQFGRSIEFTGDGNRIIIGAATKNGVPGYVEVYENNDNTWTQVGQRLFEFENSTVNRFGTDVDISADGSILLISDENDLSASGSIYLYTQTNDEEWSLINKFSGEINQLFGSSISMSDSGNILSAGSTGFINDNGDYVGSVRTFINETVLNVNDINDLTTNKIQVFPNPFNSDITIQKSENTLNFEYRIIDNLGRIVKPYITVNNQQSSTDIKLNDVVSGIYYLEIKSKDNLLIKRIIKI